jgi:hypothetical protein
VEALVVVLDDDLPVRVDLVHDPHADRSSSSLNRSNMDSSSAPSVHRSERPRLSRQAHEEEAA